MIAASFATGVSPPRADWASTMSVATRLRLFQPRAAKSPRALLLACVVAGLAASAVHGVRAAALDATGYTPTLYVFQNNQLIDVKTFKIADLQQCQRRASALLQLYLNHSDIEDDMSVVVKCVPVPPATIAHRKGEQAT
jgi:hypothetical protein